MQKINKLLLKEELLLEDYKTDLQKAEDRLKQWQSSDYKNKHSIDTPEEKKKHEANVKELQDKIKWLKQTIDQMGKAMRKGEKPANDKAKK